jgi:hypothetical protein
MQHQAQNLNAKAQRRYKAGLKTLLLQGFEQLNQRFEAVALQTSAIADRLDEVEREHDPRPKQAKRR